MCTLKNIDSDPYFKTKHLPYSDLKIILKLNFVLHGREEILVLFHIRENPEKIQIRQSLNSVLYS